VLFVVDENSEKHKKNDDEASHGLSNNCYSGLEKPYTI
jgi:hypothetical protein